MNCNREDGASHTERIYMSEEHNERERASERERHCVLACFSSLSTRVIVKGLCWPGGRPTAIFIVRNVATVMSNWELWDECICGI